MVTRKSIDWEAVEASYRSGSPSVRALAEAHGVTEGAIRKRATKEGWARDLTEKVKQATNEKLVRAQVRTEGTQRTDAEIVSDEADIRAAIVLTHRAGLVRWQSIADKLSVVLAEMDVTADNAGDFARSLNAGVDAQLKVIKGQRQAYNLGDDNGEGSTPADANLTIQFVKPSNGN